MTHRVRNALVLAGLITTGCRDWPGYSGAFDVPHAIAVLQPEVGGPFTEPVGFVGNLHGGQIVPLALKQGRFLPDAANVAYLRGNQLAAGHQRILAGLAVVADGDTVTVLGADRRFGQLVEIPYSTGVDAYGAPVRPVATVSEPVSEGSGSASLEGLEVKTGWTSTEDWVVERLADGWRVTGSRSGVQRDLAQPDVPYVAVRRAVAFTVRGVGEIGDRFTFSTDASVVEHDLGGVPIELRLAPDQSLAALVVQPDGGEPELRLFDPRDPASAASAPALPLVRPGRLAWSADSARLFAADSAGGAWEIDVPGGAVRFLDLPWATSDVAHLQGPDGDLLWLVPEDGKHVWTLDLASGDLIDTNPWVPGTQGMLVDAPIAGIEAMPLPYLFLQEADDGIRRFERAVAVSVSSGRVLFSAERDGCLVTNRLGPRTNNTNQFGTTTGDYTRQFDQESPFGAFLEQNFYNTRHVLPNPCGGVTRAQSWNLRFDSVAQAWQVEGSLSGVQPTLAREDERYVSDDGEISFVIRSGSTPSQEGWQMTFAMVDGLTSAEGDNDQDGATREVVLDQPGDPVYFHYRVGPSDQGWRPVDDRPFVLVAGQGSDRVGRAMPQEGLIDASWD